jgi:glycosyltransferase involved in cell wall biosynthesis
MNKIVRLVKLLLVGFLRKPIQTVGLCSRAALLMIQHPSKIGEIGKNINRIVVLREEGHPLLKEPIRIEHSDPFLVMTTQYPKEGDEYRNMFIHRHVKLYENDDVRADVFAYRHGNYLTEYEYEGVRVFEGDWAILAELLKGTKYETALVYFVTAEMIDAINECGRDMKRFIWLEGAGAEGWRRRSFEWTEEEIKEQEVERDKADEALMAFNRSIYTDPRNFFIPISECMIRVATEDAGCELGQYQIIPNVIDGELFAYKEKTAEMRKKILSIRPYVGRKYGNDMMIETILALSKESWFDECTFTLFGDGKDFDEATAPVRAFPNVTVHRRFLSQPEIAEQHEQHGIMLIPTRHDTQGVAMGEAMASGLVPVTNAVWAIPEFADESCAILSPDDDFEQMVEGIKNLYHDSDRFQQMSANAAKRARAQCGSKETIQKEIELITGR